MISILMPIYNGIEFIDESINSVLEQTFTEWELIIGINGHPENSEVYKIAKKYVTCKIKVYDCFNITGKATTLNELLKYCKYDYIALLDVDDIWHQDKLTIQSTMINKYDVIGSKCIYFGDINDVIPDILNGDLSNYDFTCGNPIINSSSLIRKTLCFWIQKDVEGIEDYELWLRLWKQDKTFYNFANVLVKHRIHKTSAFNSRNISVKQLLENYSKNIKIEMKLSYY